MIKQKKNKENKQFSCYSRSQKDSALIALKKAGWKTKSGRCTDTLGEVFWIEAEREVNKGENKRM